MVLVLYKQKVDSEGGGGGGGATAGTWETKCDYVRVWSPASTCAEFHHHAMAIVAEHLKAHGKVPHLMRIHVWSDGHTSTYRGAPNFGRMAYWPLVKPERAAEGRVEEVTLDLSLSEPLGVVCSDRLLVREFHGQAASKLDEALRGSSTIQGEAALHGQAADDFAVQAEKMKVAELRAALSERGLSTTGAKTELLDRLFAALGIKRGARQWRVVSVGGTAVRTAVEFRAALSSPGATVQMRLIEVRVTLRDRSIQQK